MAMGSLDKGTVGLVAGQMKMTQRLDMIIFQNINWGLERSMFGSDKEGVVMTIVMKRKITSEMMTTYFPSLLLTAITFATTFFKPIFFEAALSVNLTTMLVLTTIFISKMEGLPPTSDIKMIDIWLVFCQLVPFTEVVLLTAMEYCRYCDTEDGYSSMRLQIDEVQESQEKKISQRCWLSQLKTIGQYKICIKILKFVAFTFSSERKVLPSVVLATLFIYFLTATMFYYNVKF